MSDKNTPETIVVETFTTDREMALWLANPAKKEELKAQYPPEEWNAEMQLISKQVVVTKRVK